MEPEIQKAGAGSPTSRSTRMLVAASTPLESHPDWYTQRKRWVSVHVLAFVPLCMTSVVVIAT